MDYVPCTVGAIFWVENISLLFQKLFYYDHGVILHYKADPVLGLTVHCHRFQTVIFIFILLSILDFYSWKTHKLNTAMTFLLCILYKRFSSSPNHLACSGHSSSIAVTMQCQACSQRIMISSHSRQCFPEANQAFFWPLLTLI